MGTCFGRAKNHVAKIDFMKQLIINSDFNIRVD